VSAGAVSPSGRSWPVAGRRNAPGGGRRGTPGGPLDGFVTGAALQWRVLGTRVMNLVTGVVNPLMFTVILVLPRRATLTGADVTAQFTGIVLASLWAASMWSAMGILRRERQDGTLAATVTGVRDPLVVLLGKMSGAIVFDAALIAVSTLLGMSAFGAVPHVGDPAGFAVGLVAVMLAGISAALLVGSALVVSRYGQQLTAALGPPVLLLGGMLVPLSALPRWLSWPGLALNLRWVQEFLRSAATGHADWAALGIALALSGAYAAGGIALFRRMLTRARREATLELV